MQIENVDDSVKKGSVTERLASNRKTKFDQLWTEFLNKIADINQVRINDTIGRELIFFRRTY